MNAHAEIHHDMEGPEPDLNLETLSGDCQVADARCVKRWGMHAETFVKVEALS